MSKSKQLNRWKNPAILFTFAMGSIIALGLAKDGIDFFLDNHYVVSLTKSVLRLDLIYYDSWWPMTEAAIAKLEFPENGIYATVFFERHIKFQYPPLSILPFMAAFEFGVSWETVTKTANLISYLSLYGIAICVYQTVIILFKTCFASIEISRKFRFVSFIIVLIGTLSFYPIMWGHYIGQVQVILDLMVSMAFVGWLQGRKYFSGAMIALASFVKPQFALLLLWAVIRKEKEFCVGLMLVFIPAAILSLAIFGFQEHLDYLKVLSYISKRGEVYWPNQSVNGLLNRLLVDANSLMWTLGSFAPYNLIVRVGTLMSTVLLILFGLFYRPKAKVGADGGPLIISALDLSTMLLILTIASPVAWSHHYGTLLPIFFAGVLIGIYFYVVTRSWVSIVSLVLLGASYFLIANYFDFANREEFSKPLINLLQSYNLYGGFILLVALFLLRSAAKNALEIARPYH